MAPHGSAGKIRKMKMIRNKQVIAKRFTWPLLRARVAGNGVRRYPPPPAGVPARSASIRNATWGEARSCAASGAR